jgi:hypothetical protein
MPRTPTQPPIAYRDRQSRVWYVSEVARLKVVSAADLRRAIERRRRELAE